MDIAVILSFIFFMSIFAGVGLASVRVKKDTTDDYLVAGRGMSPPLAALSAVSTWNSGYMFIGFIGVFMELLTGMGTAFGLGMYLPMVVTLPMVVGGALRDYWEARFLDVAVEKEGLSEKQRTMRLLNTYMIATGCIVGEALLGTFLAIYYVLPLVTG